jgi:hypothetical protein
MRGLGRGLQFFGLLLLPLAMGLELTGNLERRFGVSDMLVMLVFGFSAFYLGRLLEGYART